MEFENKVITLRSWAGKMKEYHFQPVKQKNGANLPFVKKVRYDSMGVAEMILTPADLENPLHEFFIPEDADIKVMDGTTFDLSKPSEYFKWKAIENSDLIVPSRWAKDQNGDLRIDGNKSRYGIAELWVDVPGEESEKSVSKYQKITKAWTFIENDSPSARRTRCKLLGKVMVNAPDSDVTDYLYKRAETKPDEIIDLYTGGDMGLRLLYIDAREKGVILKKDGVYMFGEAALGSTDEAVMLYFKNPLNKRVLDQIKLVTYPEYTPVSKLQEIINEGNETVEQETDENIADYAGSAEVVDKPTVKAKKK